MTRDEEFTLVDGYLGVDYQPGFHEAIQPWLKAQLPGSAGFVPGIARLGIPALTESDASLGVANGGSMRPGDTATALPASILTAATFNPGLAFEAGAMLGKEARAKGFNVMLAAASIWPRAARRAHLRIFRRRLLAGRHHGGRIHPRHSKPKHHFDRQALRAQRPGNRAHRDERQYRRRRSARERPARLRTGTRTRRSGRHHVLV